MVAAALISVYVVWVQKGATADIAVTAATSSDIVLTPRGYEPSEVVIKKGSTITFSTTLEKAHWPASNLHPQHTIFPEFDPKRPLASDEEWSFTFDTVGVWNFHDHIRSYYVGTITVIE